MKSSGKTLVIGIILGLCAALLLAAAGTPTTGRYHVSASGTNVWVLDSETGQIWSTEKRADDSKPNWMSTEPIHWIDYGFPMKGQGR